MINERQIITSGLCTKHFRSKCHTEIFHEFLQHSTGNLSQQNQSVKIELLDLITYLKSEKSELTKVRQQELLCTQEISDQDHVLVIFKIFYSGAQEICFLGSIVTNLHNKLRVIYTFYLQRDMYTIYTIYKFLMKSFHGKNCFGFAGMNTSVQGQPPLHHYSSFQSLFFSENIFYFFI